jgi:hypothetical protein
MKADETARKLASVSRRYDNDEISVPEFIRSIREILERHDAVSEEPITRTPYEEYWGSNNPLNELHGLREEDLP